MPHPRRLIALAVLIAACGRVEAPPAERSAPPPASLSDAQILGVLAAANQTDSSAGAIATQNGADPRVRAFGERLAADHGGAAVAGAALAGREGLTPAASATRDRFRALQARNQSVLGRESGGEFDRVFVENEADYHAMMLHVLDDTLTPAARGAALREHLGQVRPVVEAHLRRAQALKDSLAGGA